MSAVAAAPLRLVAFGDLEGTVWGAAMDASEPAIVFGTAAASEAIAGAEHIQFLVEGDRWHLSGPGLGSPARLSVAPAPSDFLGALAGNRKLFPRGLDLYFVAGARIAALPRTTLVEA